MANRYSATSTEQVARRYSPATKKGQLALEKRVRWTVALWGRLPTLDYNETITAIRNNFGVGETTAEVTYARARERMVVSADPVEVERARVKILAQLDMVFEGAVADRKWNAASRNRREHALISGVLQPKVKVEHSGDVNVHQLAHLAILSLTPVQRERRELELREKAGLMDLDVQSLDALVASALDVPDASVELPAATAESLLPSREDVEP